jgi:hypothetical protein
MRFQQSKHLFLILLTISLNTLFSQRSLYVNGFNTILNSATQRNTLLQYAQNHQITQLNLYDLHLVHNEHNLTNTTSNQILANFIKDAKQNYGITKMAATGENAWFFQNRIMAYNATRSLSVEKFDILGLEFEFWTNIFVQNGGVYCVDYLNPEGLSCDSAGAFIFCKNQLQQMKTMATASTHPMTVEMYVGWPNAGQLKTIANIVDKTLIHAYVTNPNTAFNYALTRLQHYSTYAGVENVSIIYSAEPDFMGPWLSANSIVSAEQIFNTAYTNATGTWKSHVNLGTFTYFTYSMMTNIALPVELIDFQGVATDNETILTWTIANSQNMEGFEIEKSLNGTDFTNLGFVPIISQNEYEFMDNDVTISAYYRLKMLDLDGQFTYSSIIYVKKGLDLTTNRDLRNRLEFSIQPNPVTNFITITSTKLLSENAIYEVYNALGIVIQKGSIKDEMIDVQGLLEGIYWLKINGSDPCKFYKN